VIGPAFKDVAAKYPSTEANIDTLQIKVIKVAKVIGAMFLWRVILLFHKTMQNKLLSNLTLKK